MDLRRPLPVLLALAGLAACSASASRPAPFPESRPHDLAAADFDVEHYAIELALDPGARALEATCRIRFRSRVDGLRRVELDLVGLEVRGVTDGEGRPLDIAHDGRRLGATLLEPLARGSAGELVVAYGGSPVVGLWFSGADAGGTPTQVFTQGQCNESRGWFPCFDHPSDRATSEVRVTMPAGWVSVAAGERVERVEQGGSVTEHWRMDFPHPSYLVTLVAGDLFVAEAEWEGVPLLFVAEERYAPWLDATFHETDEILAFLSEYTGLSYPFSKYSQACVAGYPWGGMENITATTLTPLALDDELGNLDEEHHDLVAHEAAHQWFGDLITCNDWSDIWLNEGFATYMTELYFEATRGVDELRARMRNNQEEYARADVGRTRRPTVWNVYKEPDDLFDELAYEGAACRLHLLRFVLGDEVFRDAVRGYVEEHAGRNVDTDDFQRAAEEASGHDLDWFFRQWFHRRGFPEFRFDWDWDESARTVVVDVRQMQESHDGTPAVFRTPVEIEVREPGGVSLHRLEIDEREERFELPAGAEPLYVRFDKHGWIPKGMIWQRSPREWLAIAAGDDDVNGRRDAVRALGGIAAESRRAGRKAHELYVGELVARLRRDPSPYVRLEAATALGRAGGLEARQRLRLAAGDDRDPRVRVAALEALRAWGESADLARFAREQFAARFSWNTMAAAAGLVCTAEPDGAYDWIVSRLSVESPHDQLAGKLLSHLAGLDDARVPDRLLAAARDEALDPTARAEAVSGIAKLSKRRIAHSHALGELLVVEDLRLRRAVVEALAELKNPWSRRLLEAYYPDASTSTERRAIEGALMRGVGGGR